jgi:hypothetical protein
VPFFVLLVALVIAALVHAFVRADPPEGRGTGRPERGRVGRLLLAYVLVGYCGLPMIAVALAAMIDPEWTIRVLQLPAYELEGFFGWAYLGMAVIATMCLRYRGVFMVAPATCWAIYFAGATLVHLHQPGAGHGSGHAYVVAVLATHLSVSVVLAAGLVLSGLLLERD